MKLITSKNWCLLESLIRHLICWKHRCSKISAALPRAFRVKLKQSISCQHRCVCATGNGYLENTLATSGFVSAPCNLWLDPKYLCSYCWHYLLLVPGQAENVYRWNIGKDPCCGLFLWRCYLQNGTWVYCSGLSLSVTSSSMAGRRCGITEIVIQ